MVPGPHPRPEATRGPKVSTVPITASRIFHVNVNCTDLDRSLRFYGDVIGLRATTHTAPTEPQPGQAFGIDPTGDGIQWDAWMLQGDAGTASPVLDLLEWKVPTPGAAAVVDPTAPGFNRLCVTTPDVAAMHGRLREAGADVWSEPVEMQLPGGGTTLTFICGDPDGTQLAFTHGPDVRLSHIAINCTDLDRSALYYADVIGLTPFTTRPTTREPAELFRLGATAQDEGERATVTRRGALLQDPATGFVVELIEWLEPRSRPSAVRRANDLGIFRMAWLTDDIDADYDLLDEAGVECYAPPATLAMGPGLPSVRALFWNDPDGACLELIESPA
jgi:catechol 2,3-dioxygenase-like lactoylglutathione lyase family enzyme